MTRFYKKVSPLDENGCRLWTGCTDGKGYGQIWLDGKMAPAHRVAYLLEVGPIPDGLQIDHVKARGCRSRRCTAIAHLEPVTNAENNLRSDSMSAQNARKSYCINNHPFDEANTRIRKDGQRVCRACHRERNRKSRQAKKRVMT
jgi:hypothetical protein